MPFLVPTIDELKVPKFYIFRAAAPHLGVSSAIKKMAQSFLRQNKKVLIFDALLGLKNFPISNKKQKRIPFVLNGAAPLSELIMQENGIDIIAGVADYNLTALEPSQQQYIKMCLKQLAKNYDTILIDMPFHTLDSIWEDMGENLWIISANKDVIISTLQACQNQPTPHLILSRQNDDFPLNQLYIFTKILCPNAQITIL